MKYLSYILLLTVFILPIQSIGSLREIVKSDEIIQKYMLGSWVVDPKDSTYNYGDGAISTYTNDGFVEFNHFHDSACTKHNYSTKGKWSINDGNLIITVVTSSRTDIHPPGTVVVDSVIDINTKQAVLKSKYGTKQYRQKSKQCIPIK